MSDSYPSRYDNVLTPDAGDTEVDDALKAAKLALLAKITEAAPNLEDAPGVRHLASAYALLDGEWPESSDF